MPPSARQLRLGKEGPRAARTRCDCGNEQLVALSSLRSGASQSCGCLWREQLQQRMRTADSRRASAERGRRLMADLWSQPGFVESVRARSSETLNELWKQPDFRQGVSARMRRQAATHGLSHHPLNPTYRGMMARCYRTTAKGYARYGGRGIRVYGPWHDLSTGIRSIDRLLGPRPKGCTLDRIDNDGHYEPGNLRWSTRRDQQLNVGHGVVLPLASPPCTVDQCLCGGLP